MLIHYTFCNAGCLRLDESRRCCAMAKGGGRAGSTSRIDRSARVICRAPVADFANQNNPC